MGILLLWSLKKNPEKCPTIPTILPKECMKGRKNGDGLTEGHTVLLIGVAC